MKKIFRNMEKIFKSLEKTFRDIEIVTFLIYIIYI